MLLFLPICGLGDTGIQIQEPASHTDPSYPRTLSKPSSHWEVSAWMSASVSEVMLLKVVLRVTRSLCSWESDEVEGTVSTKTDHIPPVQL
jgi:hypothetical protein